jgi:hypothetical protein
LFGVGDPRVVVTNCNMPVTGWLVHWTTALLGPDLVKSRAFRRTPLGALYDHVLVALDVGIGPRFEKLSTSKVAAKAGLKLSPTTNAAKPANALFKVICHPSQKSELAPDGQLGSDRDPDCFQPR